MSEFTHSGLTIKATCWGAPDGYGQFFMDEARRSVGL